ncbi:MAG: ATP-dependent metallopeptidase FtsH/Yme1/Tma family protein [Elusimicrobiaceae bacterium]|jgi:cell division protease FtsH|nr:ATP-dependent metallopeptidase FtsH/Yme1/Tma family protein [Elusimicrobiaceae bacterium]MBT3954656.1 ATP-dependent metallopeptidase FtsH/Yme1/Tma family protein [Elusimicrobiaceae bacterium]MBT4007727.1 ATP-dependent metallopeptidase FtsH/Yme1/Tma family protein [Elusimicrobiaceae bacterium]MBT4402830.1 ATP-dependent metallopeptidase FtsH/Yme1/Tma family protein [Elusimicrobiaceae bacterium]MBT4440086.1 ATP-dependent metallopeptidase FtsH/Yme1/Tma family protein [Elusimicrobiaceae bacterium
MNKKSRKNKNLSITRQVLLWALAFVLLIGIYNKMNTSGVRTDVAYSEFKQKLKSGEVSDIAISNNMITGTLKQGNRNINFKTVALNDANLIDQLEASGVSFKAEPDKTWVSNLLINLSWILLFIFLFWFLFLRQAQAGGKQAFSFAKSKAKLQDPQKQKVTFKDVAGCDEAKEELQEVIKFLKDPKKFQRLGAKLPKGILLYGLPGTGKTLLARAVAGEAGVNFFTASASEFVEMFVGVGASRVRDLFVQAKKSSPSIIFIDELDAVGRRRFAGIGGGHDEREQTLNQLLIELDGFEAKEGVILMASTNRPDVLDPALTRPGRFDRHVNVPSPDIKGRKEILEVHARKVKLNKKADLSVIAKTTPGFVGADLANVINEGALLAARNDKPAVDLKDFEEAVERVIAGPQRKSKIISERERKTIACHEAGHTIVAKRLPNADPVHKVSIIPRGPALGYTLQLPLEDKYLTTKSEILDKLAILLGGRAAEEIVFGEITTGAHDDLSKATSYARKMVAQLGMSENIGPLSVEVPEDQVFLGRDISKHRGYSEDLAKRIDDEVASIVKKAYEDAKQILIKDKKALDTLVAKLLKKEVVEAEEIETILNGKPKKEENLEEKKA